MRKEKKESRGRDVELKRKRRGGTGKGGSEAGRDGVKKEKNGADRVGKD